MAHIQPVLNHLYWLLVEYRVKFKVFVLPFKALSGLESAAYLQVCVPQYVLRRGLHCVQNNLLMIPGPKDVWLSLARAKVLLSLAPTWQNSLTNTIRALWGSVQFCRSCKAEILVEDSNRFHHSRHPFLLPKTAHLPLLLSCRGRLQPRLCHFDCCI